MITTVVTPIEIFVERLIRNNSSHKLCQKFALYEVLGTHIPYRA